MAFFGFGAFSTPVGQLIGEGGAVVCILIVFIAVLYCTWCCGNYQVWERREILNCVN